MNFEKLKSYCFLGLVFSMLQISYAQKGVGTNQPNKSAAFEVKATNKGLLIPRVSLQSLDDFEPITGPATAANSLLVYNEGDELPKGFYYWDAPNTQWTRLLNEQDLNTYEPPAQEVAAPRFFYMPSLVLPLTQNEASGDHQDYDSDTGIFAIQLHEIYQQQFGNPAVASPGSNPSLPLFDVDQLFYYVTYYDEAVFEEVALSAEGVLTYKVLSQAEITMDSYMNIVFEVKED